MSDRWKEPKLANIDPNCRLTTGLAPHPDRTPGSLERALEIKKELQIKESLMQTITLSDSEQTEFVTSSSRTQ